MHNLPGDPRFKSDALHAVANSSECKNAANAAESSADFYPSKF